MGKQSYFHKKTVRDVPLDGQTILIRADYNVPLSSEGKIDDDYRILQSIPTLKYLLEERGCSLVICSHLGRPEGEVNKKYSLKPVAKRLEELLGKSVTFVTDCVGDKVSVRAKKLKPGQVVLLENLRFHPEEEANDATFAKRLARSSHATYFVQDGFGVVHRAHASTSAITQFLPSVAGLLIEREYQHLLSAMHAPKKPLVAILGGAKINDKIEIIDVLVHRADQIIIGGAMANTFLKYKGFNIGKSLAEEEKEVLDKLYRDAAHEVGQEKLDDFLLLPTDVAVAEEIDAKQPRKEVASDKVHDKEIILDIGVDTSKRIDRIIAGAGTVIWNGTLGLAELPVFAEGSENLAISITRNKGLTSIIGGGDTADFVLDFCKKHPKQHFTHISTGGGASLELMSGKKLPGVEALLKA